MSYFIPLMFDRFDLSFVNVNELRDMFPIFTIGPNVFLRLFNIRENFHASSQPPIRRISLITSRSHMLFHSFHVLWKQTCLTHDACVGTSVGVMLISYYFLTMTSKYSYILAIEETLKHFIKSMKIQNIILGITSTRCPNFYKWTLVL
jgi:hypothetical protein